MGTSLRDIALKLKVSKTTVSWVLSGQGDSKGISKKTQKRVLECARELNYQPNLLARSLNSGNTGTIGLIIPSISDSFYSEVAREIESRASEEGYSLMICSSESEIERETRMIRLLRSKQVDGIILAPTKRSSIEIERLIEDSFPFVLFDRYYPELAANYVIINNEESSYLLVKHLIEKGCKKIALVTTNPHLRTMEMRCEGYEIALKEAGISFDNRLRGTVEYEGYQKNIPGVLDKIRSEVSDVDGFFFTTHILAIEAFRYFYSRNIDINKGYGLACIHEEPFFDVMAPHINIARMPVEKIGSETVRILNKNIKLRQENKDEPAAIESVSLQCDIIFRD